MRRLNHCINLIGSITERRRITNSSPHPQHHCANLLHELYRHTLCTSLIGSITASRCYFSVTEQPMQSSMTLCYLHLALVLAMLIALNPVFLSSCVFAIIAAIISMHAWSLGQARTILLVVCGSLYLLPVVFATLLIRSVVCHESTICLVLPLLTMAMLPTALLPQWRLIELDDGSMPLPPGYKAWWRAHRCLLQNNVQRRRA